MNNVVYDVYQLKKNADTKVMLTVTIGYAQDATVKVRLNQNTLGEFDNSFKLDLGTNDALHRCELKIEAFVTDIQDDFDIVSMMVVISGGHEPQVWSLFQRPTTDHETYPLTATIGLYK